MVLFDWFLVSRFSIAAIALCILIEFYHLLLLLSTYTHWKFHFKLCMGKIVPVFWLNCPISMWDKFALIKSVVVSISVFVWNCASFGTHIQFDFSFDLVKSYFRRKYLHHCFVVLFDQTSSFPLYLQRPSKCMKWNSCRRCRCMHEISLHK